MFDHGQPILPAQPVGFPLHVVVILFGTVVLDPVNERNRVHHKVVVQVIGFIQVGCHQHLVFLTPQCFCQLQPDLMGHFRGGLAGGKALIAVISHRAFLLAKPLFYGHHLITGGGGAAIHPGNKSLHDRHILIVHHRFSRFLLLDGILDHVGKALGLLCVHVWFLKAGGVFPSCPGFRYR